MGFATALRQRHVLQVLVDHHLQVVVGAVDVGVERHVTLLHGAGGGPLAWGGVCAQQVAQAQFVVAVTRDLHHVVACGVHWGQHHVGGFELELRGHAAVGRCGQLQLGHLLGAQGERPGAQ